MAQSAGPDAICRGRRGEGRQPLGFGRSAQQAERILEHKPLASMRVMGLLTEREFNARRNG
jgi:hypothetical protein